MKVELLKFMKPFVGFHASCVAKQEEFFLISAFDSIRIIFVVFFCIRLAFVNVA